MQSIHEQDNGGQHEAPTDGEQSQSMSLLGGVARPEGLPQADQNELEAIDESGGRGLSQGTILVIAVVVIAAGSLYAMRLTHGKIAPDTSQAEARMEQILAKLSNPAAISDQDPLHPEKMRDLFRDTDKIVGMLKTDLGNQQVPVEYVKKNPFKLGISKPEDKPTRTVSNRNDEAMLKRLRSETSRYSLQTVMNGASGPIAVIDGDFYTQGKTLGSFKIVNIDASTLTVTLAAQGHTFELTMND